MGELSGLLVPSFGARALLIGQKLDLRAWPKGDTLAPLPLTVRVTDGIAVLFRYGVVVFFTSTGEADEPTLQTLKPLVGEPHRRTVVEDLKIRVESGSEEALQEGRLTLTSVTLERLQIVADVLSKSVLLDYYEKQIARDFDRIEPLARELETHGRLHGSTKAHLKRIGALLLLEQHMVGRAEINEKPEVLWEHPKLERMYALLVDEFEIRERSAALERKIDLVARTMRTLVDLLDTRHTLHVEWYIVLLIVFEIVLALLYRH